MSLKDFRKSGTCFIFLLLHIHLAHPFNLVIISAAKAKGNEKRRTKKKMETTHGGAYLN